MRDYAGEGMKAPVFYGQENLEMCIFRCLRYTAMEILKKCLKQAE